jgi:alcohol dehydrogenase class IV
MVSDAAVVKAGLAKRIEDLLLAEKIPYQLVREVEPEPSIAAADQCIAFAKQMGG